jgi:hypothetical protein
VDEQSDAPSAAAGAAGVEPDFEDIRLRWDAAMRRGDFEAAWRQTDRIEAPRRARQRDPGFVREPQHLTWNGEPFEDRDVLVRCEHGLGDTLQFIRYVPLLRQRARSVTVLVQPALLTLLDGSDEFGNIRDGWSDAPPPRHDVEIEVMELPYALRSMPQSVPATIPYLPVDAIRARAAQLPPIERDGALKVGLVWAASDWDRTRSIPLDALAPLGRVPGVRFYSLQQGEQAAAYADAPFAIEPYSTHTGEIAAAAAAMLELDLVITVDAMAAHLAGALGRPVWALLKHRADWRWMDAVPRSPWYPTMRLFRQVHEGDWSAVADAAAKALGRTAVQR